jgi:flagellar biogenesis protein FliO
MILFFAEEVVQPLVAPAQEIMVQSYEGAFLKMFLTLIGLLVAVFVTVWIMRKGFRGGRGGSGQAIQILERKAISPKTTLFLLKINEKKVVIAESQLEIKRIATLDDFDHTQES